MIIDHHSDENITINLNRQELREITHRLYSERINGNTGSTIRMSHVDVVIDQWSNGKETEFVHLYGGKGGRTHG